MVTVDLEVTQEYLVKPGDAVSVVLPDGVTTVGGRVESVGNVAVCPGGSGSGTGNGSGVADQSPCQASGSGNSSTPTVTMTVSLDRVPAGATLDQAPVNVNITTDRADDVLAVPVNALLALAGGGFGVRGGDRQHQPSGGGDHRPVRQHPGPGQRGRPDRRHAGGGALVMTVTVPCRGATGRPGRSRCWS